MQLPGQGKGLVKTATGVTPESVRIAFFIIGIMDNSVPVEFKVEILSGSTQLLQRLRQP